MEKQILYSPLTGTSASIALKVHVNSVARLYKEINNPNNKGKTIVLAPGTYELDPGFQKNGRLELQFNMSLEGQQGHPEDVIIDVTKLPESSYKLGTPVNTAPIRLGNGNNAVEWITVQNTNQNNPIRALIQTDLVNTPANTTHVRVAHTILKGASIGLCLINRYSECDNRIVEADIEENEIMENTIDANTPNGPRHKSGIQIQNSHGVSGAFIRAFLKNNYVHDNGNGIAVFNAAPMNSTCNQNTISVKSDVDRFENNGVGIALIGGNTSTIGARANGNSTQFKAKDTIIRNNQGNPSPFNKYNSGGVFATAGLVYGTGEPGSVNHNKLEIKLMDCLVENNIVGALNSNIQQVDAYGAYSKISTPTDPAGTYNKTVIHLEGISRLLVVNTDNSEPDEQPVTNTVLVHN